MNKKAVQLTTQTIIVFVIALLVLLLLSVYFVRNYDLAGGKIMKISNDTAKSGLYCIFHSEEPECQNGNLPFLEQSAKPSEKPANP